LLAALSSAVLALGAVTAAASASPSPSLAKVLAPPPGSDYVEADTTVPGFPKGRFTAQQYGATRTGAASSQVAATLESDRFVEGYGRAWVQRQSQHVLIEEVLAFDFRDGAESWLASSKLSDQTDSTYAHPIFSSELGTDYYGVHFASTPKNFYADAFTFVKGNDYFVVRAVSRNDDLGSVATTQAMAQYAFAPNYTITFEGGGLPANTLWSRFGDLLLNLRVPALVLGMIGLVVGLALLVAASVARLKASFIASMQALAKLVRKFKKAGQLTVSKARNQVFRSRSRRDRR
jgi:hypothetical protein